jgi:hypothetical protein
MVGKNRRRLPPLLCDLVQAASGSVGPGLRGSSPLRPGADVMNAIGPNLVIALLMDGPQREHRWPGRYATVLADDPGSAVLTVTCLEW